MICELCGNEHNGSYGSGRFCSSKCARSFSTSKNREKINQRVSNTLKLRHKQLYGMTKPEAKLRAKTQKLHDILNDPDNSYIRYPNIDFGDRYVANRNGKIISLFTLKEIKHVSYKCSDRYRRVVLMDTSGKQHMLYLHRIIAETFIPNPNQYPIINHKDENPANNCVENLEWCTQSYNMTYNDLHKRIGKKVSKTIRERGGAWNKGKHFV